MIRLATAENCETASSNKFDLTKETLVVGRLVLWMELRSDSLGLVSEGEDSILQKPWQRVKLWPMGLCKSLIFCRKTGFKSWMICMWTLARR